MLFVNSEKYSPHRLLRAFSLFLSAPVLAEKIPTLDLESDDGALLYLAHNITSFPFDSTASYSEHEGGNLSKRITTDALLKHLGVMGLIKIDGEVVGMASELEYIDRDVRDAKSAWLFILNHPEWKGTFAVEQIERCQVRTVQLC